MKFLRTNGSHCLSSTDSKLLILLRGIITLSRSRTKYVHAIPEQRAELSQR